MDEGGRSARSDLLGGAGWMIVGLAVVAGAWRMDRFESVGASIYTIPGLVPGLIGALVAVLGAVLALRGWRRLRVDPGPAGEPLVNRRVALMLVLAGVYAVGFVGHAPFWLGTALFVAAFTFLYAPAEPALWRRIVVALVAGAVTSAAVSYVFEDIFLVRLP